MLDKQPVRRNLTKILTVGRGLALAGWIMLMPGALAAQTFCGRTLAQWSAAGAHIIDQRGAPCGQTIIGSGGVDLILGTPCADQIHGKPGADCIYGFDGNDTIFGDAGNDEIHGGAGNDTLWGDAGNDILYGDAGGDELIGDSGDDRLEGGTGDDRLKGDSGRDVLLGGRGDDRLKGDSGRDLLCGQSDNDLLDGDSSRDRLDGGAAQDDCNGGASQDRCYNCESSTKCSRESGSICPDDPNVLEGVADPGCTVCARHPTRGDLYCTVAGSDGHFTLSGGSVPPSTTAEDLPAGVLFEVFCIRCHGDAVSAMPNTDQSIDVRCARCAGTELTAGSCNFFQGCSPGQPSEPASPSANLYQFMYQNSVLATPGNPRPPLDFDQIPGQNSVATDSPFGHTFVGLPTGICGATLTATLQAGNPDATNDGLGLEIQGPNGPFGWSGGVAAATGVAWGAGTVGTASLDLANLPGGQSLISSLADGSLDLYLQDDTGVDCLKLCLELCTDLTLDKKLTGGSLDGTPHWQLTLNVRNVGNASTHGPITVSDTLDNALAFVSGGGNGWSCQASGQVVTCTYSGPPIAAGASSPILLVVEPANRDVFKDLDNCATVTLDGDTNPANDQGCVSLPCPESGDPWVHYLDGSESDPALCAAAGPELCSGDQTWFWGTCGCGCLNPVKPCPDPNDPRVSYVSQDPGVCSIVHFFCQPGQNLFSDACGCGCITPPGCPLASDPGIDYLSNDPELCSQIDFYCPLGQPFFSPCGCGCRDFDLTSITLRLFGTSSTGSGHVLEGREELPTQVDLGDGQGLELEAEWQPGSRLGLALSLSYQRDELRTETRFGPGGTSLVEEGRGDTWLVALGGHLHLTPRRRFDLYLGPIVGLLEVADPPGFDADSDIALGLSLGLDITTAGRWGFTARARYLEADIDLQPSGGTPEMSDTIGLESWSFGFGWFRRF